jgi:hypothetical protein
VDLLDRAVGVDDDDAVGGDLGDLLVGLGDGALQLEPLGLEAVVAVGAAEADLGVDRSSRSGRARGRRSRVGSEITSPTPRPRAPPW